MLTADTSVCWPGGIQGNIVQHWYRYNVGAVLRLSESSVSCDDARNLCCFPVAAGVPPRGGVQAQERWIKFEGMYVCVCECITVRWIFIIQLAICRNSFS